MKVVINWGHRFNTPGKQTPVIPELGRRIKEYEFNRPTAYLLKAELERCGIEVVMVGSETYDMPLEEIVRKANATDADIFVSIHFNALDGTFDEPTKEDPDGTGIFYHTGSSKGKRLAEMIGKYLPQSTSQKWRGVRDANFYVLRYTTMPAVLSENGFMDDRREAALMLNKDFQKEVAIEHAKGICDYFGITYVPEVVVQAPSEKPAADDWMDRVKALLVVNKIMSDGDWDKPVTKGQVASWLYTAMVKEIFK